MTATFGLPINMLDNFEAALAPGRHPVPLVSHAYAVQIAEAVGDPKPAAYRGVKPYEGPDWSVICPECGGVMTKEEGVIGEIVMSTGLRAIRKARPAVFLACWTCEHCEEVQ